MYDFDAVLVSFIHHLLGEVPPVDLEARKLLVEDGSDGLFVVELQKHARPEWLVRQLPRLPDRFHCNVIPVLLVMIAEVGD